VTGWADHGLELTTDMLLVLAAAGSSAADVVHRSLGIGYSGFGSVGRTLLVEPYWDTAT
jgi:hypothetical protein